MVNLLNQLFLCHLPCINEWSQLWAGWLKMNVQPKADPSPECTEVPFQWEKRGIKSERCHVWKAIVRKNAIIPSRYSKIFVRALEQKWCSCPMAQSPCPVRKGVECESAGSRMTLHEGRLWGEIHQRNSLKKVVLVNWTLLFYSHFYWYHVFKVFGMWQNWENKYSVGLETMSHHGDIGKGRVMHSKPRKMNMSRGLWCLLYRYMMLRRLSDLLQGKAHPRRDCHGEPDSTHTALVW